MKQKTAVEKLEILLLGIVSFDSEELRKKYKEAFKQAKAMEKEQIINACQSGFYSGLDIVKLKETSFKSSEQYYTETYGETN